MREIGDGQSGDDTEGPEQNTTYNSRWLHRVRVLLRVYGIEGNGDNLPDFIRGGRLKIPDINFAVHGIGETYEEIAGVEVAFEVNVRSVAY